MPTSCRSSEVAARRRWPQRLALALLLLVVAPLGGGAWRYKQNNDDMMKEPHTAVDLTGDNFNTLLVALPPGTPCIVKFYASWCPHCHHYAPVYEKVAAYFKRLAERPGGPTVFVGRIDCAEHLRVCSKFTKLQSFPSVMVATAQRLLAHNDTGYAYLHQAKPHVLIKEVGALLNRTLEYVEPPSPPSPPPPPRSAKGTGAYDLVWSQTDVESATRMLWHFIVSTPRMHTGPEVRKALRDLVHWWSVSHAIPACRESAAHVLQLWGMHYWPDAQAEGAAPKALTSFKMCGKGAWREGPQSWAACKGAKASSRGFTCGLWLLFHTSASRLPLGSVHHTSPAQVMVAALRGFATHFFQCEVCQKHFSQIMANPALEDLRTRRDAVLWLWRTHNEVNARLAMFETMYGYSSSGDPAHPKVQWPTAAQCARCRLPSAAPAGDKNDEQPRFLGLESEGGGKDAAVGQGRAGGEAAAAGSEGGGASNATLPATIPEVVEWDEDQVLLFLDRIFGGEATAQGVSAAALAAAAESGEGGHLPSEGQQGDGAAASALGRRGGSGGGGDAGGVEAGAGKQSPRPWLLVWPVVALLAGACAALGWALLLALRARVISDFATPASALKQRLRGLRRLPASSSSNGGAGSGASGGGGDSSPTTRALQQYGGRQGSAAQARRGAGSSAFGGGGGGGGGVLGGLSSSGSSADASPPPHHRA